MISNLIIKKFIKNYDDVKNKEVRERYGYLGGIVGILINLLLLPLYFLHHHNFL